MFAAGVPVSRNENHFSSKTSGGGAATTGVEVPSAESSARSLSSEKDPVQKMSREELLGEVTRMQQELTTLKAFRVFKEGNLARCRETMTGEEWAVRYYECKPGFLRCYKSYEERILRLEVKLYWGVKVQTELLPLEDHGKFKYVITVDLGAYAKPIPGQPMKEKFHFIKFAAESAAEAQDWVEAIAAGAQDGGPAPALPAASPRPKADHGGAASKEVRDVHRKHQASFLSSDNPDRQSYRGLFNLLIIVCVVSNLRAGIDSAVRHGNFLAKMMEVQANLTPNDYLAVGCFFVLPLFVFAAYGIERLSTTTHVSNQLSRVMHILNVSGSLVVPCLVTHLSGANPAVGGPLVFMSTVLFLKVFSYAHTNTVLRELWVGEKNHSSAAASAKSWLEPAFGAVSYPHNLSLLDIWRFMSFPTLCYQTSYPRTTEIRRSWLLKRVAELVVTLLVQFIMFQQFVLPVLEQAELATDIVSYSGHLLRIAIPSLGAWMCMFYALFHLWLNILAELTMFGDRQFYKAWWNATRLDVYWRDWNIPVHAWLVRHCFFPCMNLGLSKNSAMIVVFLVSAGFHELLVSVPCHTAKTYAFWGMMGQLPLIAITNYIDKKTNGSQIGNAIFWISFCIVGQPLCIMLYYHEMVHVNMK